MFYKTIENQDQEGSGVSRLIDLAAEVRKRDPFLLTEDEMEAAVYYLQNLITLQHTEGTAT